MKYKFGTQRKVKRLQSESESGARSGLSGERQTVLVVHQSIFRTNEIGQWTMDTHCLHSYSFHTFPRDSSRYMCMYYKENATFIDPLTVSYHFLQVCLSVP